jgi:hypothetical protein
VYGEIQNGSPITWLLRVQRLHKTRQANECSGYLLRLIMDVTAMVFSGVGIVKGIRAWKASGSPLKWFNDPKSGEIIWPPNRGFLGEPERVTLMPGTRVDRYGFEGGTFVSPEGTPYEMRLLAPGTQSKPYNYL